MRRFSQRHSLVTLSDINITPLLDLAFVLLIIFMITTPLLEQGLNLRLPAGDIPENKKLDPGDIKTVEIGPLGETMLSRIKMSPEQIENQLVKIHQRNPKLVVYIRADKAVAFDHVAALLNRLERNGIDQVSIRTTPPARTR